MRRNHDYNYKLEARKETKKSNNVQAARKFGVSQTNIRRWRKNEDKVKKANSTRNAVRGPKNRRCEQIDKRVLEYVMEKRNEGLSISREAMMMMKAQEIARELKISRSEFKVSLCWCTRMMRRSGLTL